MVPLNAAKVNVSSPNRVMQPKASRHPQIPCLPRFPLRPLPPAPQSLPSSLVCLLLSVYLVLSPDWLLLCWCHCQKHCHSFSELQSSRLLGLVYCHPPSWREFQHQSHHLEQHLQIRLRRLHHQSHTPNLALVQLLLPVLP